MATFRYFVFLTTCAELCNYGRKCLKFLREKSACLLQKISSGRYLTQSSLDVQYVHRGVKRVGKAGEVDRNSLGGASP